MNKQTEEKKNRPAQNGGEKNYQYKIAIK